MRALVTLSIIAVISGCGPSTHPVGPGTQPPGPPGQHPGPSPDEAATEPMPAPPAPPPPVASTAPVGPTGMLKGILAAHNQVRDKHCVPALTWSPKLAAYAQEWANTLRDKGCAFDHRPRSPYGENLAMFGPPGGTNATEILMGWYNEIKHYDFSKHTFSFQTGHFTQVVWKATTQLGCGRAVCKGAELWVCNYAPAGNVSGSFAANVPRPCK